MEEWTRISDVPTRLREAMQLSGKKQADLVRDTGLNKSTISRYISGAVEPRLEQTHSLAKALGVDPMWLWGYDVPMERSAEMKRNDELERIIKRLQSDPVFFSIVSAMNDMGKTKDN
jgi:transcriptional regulator with XRE-family HTH domain